MRRSSIAVAEKEKKGSRLRSDLEIYELESREGDYYDPDGPKVVNDFSRVPRDKRRKSLSDEPHRLSIFRHTQNDDNSSVNTCSPY